MGRQPKWAVLKAGAGCIVAGDRVVTGSEKDAEAGRTLRIVGLWKGDART